MVELEQILKNIEQAREFVAWEDRDNKLTQSLEESLPPTELLPEFSSHRRKNAFYQVVRTLALLEQKSKVSADHITKAYDITHRNFLKLRDMN